MVKILLGTSGFWQYRQAPAGAIGGGGGGGLFLFEQPIFLPLPIPILLTVAFVVQFFALGQADLQLGAAPLPVHGRGHQGVAGALDQTDEAMDLGPPEKQFPVPGGVRSDVGGGAGEGGNVATEQEGLALNDPDVTFPQLHTAGTGAFDFPALQAEARLEALLDMVIMPCLLIEGDGGLSGLGFGFTGHGDGV